MIAFDLVTGRMVTRVAASGWSWTRELSKVGTFEAKVTDTDAALPQRLWENARPWRTVLVDADWVDHPDGRGIDAHASGVVHSRNFDVANATLTCDGFGSVFSKLLVISAALRDAAVSGQIIDHEAEDVVVPQEWMVHVSGSTGDMIRQLVELALQWQSFPVILPTQQGGTQYRDYFGTDLALVSDRIDDIAGLQGGAEWTWVPQIIGGRLFHRLDIGSPELVPQRHRIDATLDGVPVTEVTLDESGADMATDVWASGGKQDDKILISRATSTALTSQGWPRLMATNTSHQSVSEIPTLADHAQTAARRGAAPSQVFSFKVRRDFRDVAPGDWIDLKWQSWFMPEAQWWALKVLQVSGDEGEWLTIRARERVA
ncbi:minor tail protein [Propionibacterium phage B3]|uniref:Minor tail protein n=1 Tax=Propionibacterium phage B3 TaxID=1897533 RepID=A0A1D8ETD8_9CAUD|nr:minor tail protein [Propionibacterium phage B3]AOT24311.1 minor tail protein [Propionibacterium phage B3]